MTKVSVILPSLNVGKYIEQCLQSVVNQTLKDIEIICVDAGSTDGTLEIIEKIAALDDRITVIHSDRKSYGYQMNLGLDASTGEYIGIVETDDWVDPDTFEVLYNAAIESGADHVRSNFYKERDGISTPFLNLRRCENKITKPIDDRTVFASTPAIWSGIYKKSLLTDNGIRFDETPGASFQDTSFIFMILCTSEKTRLLDECHLHYRIDNENSSVHSAGKMMCLCDEMHYIEDFLNKKSHIKEKIYNFYLAFKYEKYRWNLERIASDLQWQFINVMRDEFLIHKAEGALDEACFTEYFSYLGRKEDTYTKTAFSGINKLLDSSYEYFINECRELGVGPGYDELPDPDFICGQQDRSKKDMLLSGLFVVRNSHESIADQMREILNSCVDDEILILDDGSADDTLKIIKESIKDDSRIRVYKTPYAIGPSAALYKLSSLTSGEYIRVIQTGLDVSDRFIRKTAQNVKKKKKLSAFIIDKNKKHIVKNEPVCILSREVLANDTGERPAAVYYMKNQVQEEDFLFENIYRYIISGFGENSVDEAAKVSAGRKYTLICEKGRTFSSDKKTVFIDPRTKLDESENEILEEFCVKYKAEFEKEEALRRIAEEKQRIHDDRIYIRAYRCLKDNGIIYTAKNAAGKIKNKLSGR